MNKLFKKMYAVLGVLVMLLPIALSAVSGSVKAEGETQNVILTKLGFTKGDDGKYINAPEKLLENGQPIDLEKEGYNAVAGVKFQIFDVTTAYGLLNQYQKKTLLTVNSADIKTNLDDSRVIGAKIGKHGVSSQELIDAGTTKVAVPANDSVNFVDDKADPASFFTTDAKGQINVNLPKDKRVYVIREVKKGDAGLKDETYNVDEMYKPSKDLILSLPQVDTDKKELDTVYLYPKNYAADNMELNFRKVDSRNKNSETNGLEGAKFVFSKNINGESYYAQKVSYDTVTNDGKNYTVSSTPAVDNNYNNIKWVKVDVTKSTDLTDLDDSYIFTSKEKGNFSIKAKPASVNNYGPVNKFRTRWNDEDFYGIAVGDKISFEEIGAPTGYEKLEKGSFKILAKDDTKASSHVTSNEKEDRDAYEFYLESTGKNVFTFEDDPTGLLPHTGGMGILLFVLAGASLIAVGAYAYKKQRA